MQKGRVIEVQRIYIQVKLESGETVSATVRGSFHETGEYPKVGDWVTVSVTQRADDVEAVIEEVLPRTSVIARLDQETGKEQIIVTNVDVVYIVMGLDGDFNIKRLERYLALVQQTDCQAVVVLNKADMVTPTELLQMTEEVQIAAGDTSVYTVTAKTGEGLEQLLSHIDTDITAVLLGSSGAGKSTITNWLLGGEVQEVSAVRAGDSRGRHTTTTRQLFPLPSGGFLIDTPGMRELGVVSDETIEQIDSFTQIEQLATDCQFRNCDHDKSAGCAVQVAVASGELSESTWQNYLRLQQEHSWQTDKSGAKNKYVEAKARRSAQSQAATLKDRLRRR